jgi:hypothetical protein
MLLFSPHEAGDAVATLHQRSNVLGVPGCLFLRRLPAVIGEYIWFFTVWPLASNAPAWQKFEEKGGATGSSEGLS